MQIDAVLVKQGGNQIISCALVGLLRQQLAEPVEGFEIGRAGRRIVRTFG